MGAPAVGKAPRPRAARAARSRPNVALTRPSAASPADVQSILSLAVRRAIELLEEPRVAAWAWKGDAPFVAAAAGRSPRRPTPAEMHALVALRAPAALAAARAPAALRAIAERHGFAVAAPVRSSDDGTAEAVLLAGDASVAPRPRLLARLGRLAASIAPQIEAATAASRIAKLDGEVRRLDRLASLGGLVAEIVHEVRNPLVSLKTFLQLLPERIDELEFRTRFFDLVTNELRRIERLLDVVLSHARPGATAPEGSKTGVAPVVESVARLVAHRALEHGVTLDAVLSDDLPGVRIGEDALRQVVLNLVLNAIEVSPAGARVRVSGRRVRGGVELRVDDEGPGLPPEIREHVFEPFVSTREERPGGLGLAISRRIVEEAGGRLRFEDRKPAGTRFRALLREA